MEEKREVEALGAEGRRSLTGGPNASGGAGEIDNEPGEAVEETELGEGEYPEEIEEPVRLPRLMCGKRGEGRLTKPVVSEAPEVGKVTPEQKLLILDTWKRSGLPAREFGSLLGLNKFTLTSWKKRFEEYGPAGLMDRPRGVKKGSKLPEVTRRAILMIKEGNPEYGCQRISDMLLRGPALPASPGAVAKVLKDAGYEFEEEPTRPHPDKVRSFERARPNQLWQTDLFTFLLKRQNRRVYLIAFMDDNSRFVVGYGLYGSCSGALVIEVLRAAVASYGAPEEILTDNGPQYATWRGKSAFTKELEKRGIKHVVAHPRRPQTLGKTERFWGTLWRECVETSVFFDLEDARKRIGLFIDHYNFQRPHQGIDGLVPSDRYFEAAPEVYKALRERVAANALELARSGIPKDPFYLTGQVGGKAFSVHAEGERVILTKEGGERREVELVKPEEKAAKPGLPEPVSACGKDLPEGMHDKEEGELPPGVSPLDAGLKQISEAKGEKGGVA
jgi:transposase InsO family protein